jgi:enoyl-CoA hydratase/carnithine racemase
MFMAGKAIPLCHGHRQDGQVIEPHSPEVLVVEQKDSVVWLTLNRPAKCNALDVELNEALLRTLQTIPSEASIVVVRGAGRHFCAGSDLKDLHQVDRTEAARVMQIELEACLALAGLPQLTVALTHGKCLGGGAILPLYCDLRIGRAGVSFMLPEVSLGWAPPYGLERLAASVPRPFALDMLLSGRVCGDEEALRQGWIQRLTKSGPEEHDLIAQLAGIPRPTLLDTLSLAATKDLKAIRAADDLAMKAFLNHFDTDHARGRIASFFEKKRS